ncbi:MAG: site-specific DNA-methyltransferase, partial [Chloroflexi bacterium]|nr:site-specific DNA-methyltransferase [Chloroflexota bacterium]
ERVSARAILSVAAREDVQRDLFADPQQEYADAVRFYEHDVDWSNRLILGDSLQVMASLAHRESLAGKVQMIYVDPPYGINFSSKFQPEIGNRTVTDRVADLTRDPEMVRAFRDTWVLGTHSYLAYLRDRFALCRELLADSGSIFVQISDENLHRVRAVLDEVFGHECFVITIPFTKKGSQKSGTINPINDYLIWYSKAGRDSGDMKFHPLFEERDLDAKTVSEFSRVLFPDGREYSVRGVPDGNGELRDYSTDPKNLPRDHPSARLYRSNPLTSGGERKNQSRPFPFRGRQFEPGRGNCFKTTVRTDDGSTPGMVRLASAERLIVPKNQLRFRSFLDDFGRKPLSNWWDGLGGLRTQGMLWKPMRRWSRDACS